MPLTDDYTLLSGNWSTFTRSATRYGQSLDIASINVGSVHRIRRNLPANLVFEELTLRFMLPTLTDNDAGWIELYSGATCVMRFQPQRKKSIDHTQQAHIIMDRAESWGDLIDRGVSHERLAANTWYELRVLVTPGNGGTSASVVSIDDAQVIGSTQIEKTNRVSDYSGITLTHLVFQADTGGSTTQTLYDNITIQTLGP